MKNLLTKIGSISVMAFPYFVLAQQYEVPSELRNVTNRLANVAVGIIITISVFFILWGAFQYLTATTSGSGGKEGGGGVKTARDTIVYAIIAIIIALLARVIINIVVQTVSPITGSGTVF